MKKAYRIKKNEEFASIIGKKHSLSSANFIVYYYDKASNSNARVGISVSKKLGDAVHRNKYKRQIRQMCMTLIDYENCPIDIIVIARKPYLENEYADNLADLEKLLKKAIIKKYEKGEIHE